MAGPLNLNVHTDREDHPITYNIPDHAARQDTPAFEASKRVVKKILAAMGVAKSFYGSGALQMHHGGSLWLLDDKGWFLVQNEAGIEWSAQFCADPAKVDQLRVNARRVYAGFPKSIPEMMRLGYKGAQAILETPITDADGVARWVDSVFNSCVPLPAPRHTGVLPKGTGRHHYPTPITDIELVKYDDFVLWVTDPDSGTPAAVVPVARRGENVNKVRLAFATPGTALERKHANAHARGAIVEFGPRSPLTHQAFVHQTPVAPDGGSTGIRKTAKSARPAAARPRAKAAGKAATPKRAQARKPAAAKPARRPAGTRSSS